jgi:hypothetical protein
MQVFSCFQRDATDSLQETPAWATARRFALQLAAAEAALQPSCLHYLWLLL